MKKERFTNLSQRIEENYPEMENEMLMELRQKDEKYVGIHKRFYDLQEQHPFILKVLEGKDDISLTRDEHDILLDYLALYRKMDEKERIHIYFRGHTDELAYLEKTGVL